MKTVEIMETNNKKLKQYFLEQLPPQEVEEIELQIISDADFSAELETAETELMEDYLENSLNAEETKLFETNYLITEERNKKLQFLKSLKQYAQKKVQNLEIKNGSPSFFESLKAIFAPRGFGLAFGSLALVLTVGISGYFVWKNYYRQSDVLVALNKYQKNERPTEARISDFDYAPKTEGTRGGKKEDDLNLVSAKSRATEAVLKIKSAENLHELGRVYLTENNYDEAIKNFEQAIKLNPNISKLHNDLGVSFLEKGRQKEEGKLELFGKASEEFSTAIELDKNLKEAYFNQGLANEPYLPNQAKEAWENYLKLDSSSKWADEARERLKKLEATKPISKTKEEILKWFETATNQKDEELAWSILSRNREMIESKLIPQQFALLFITAKSENNNAESERYLNLLNYVGTLEEKKSGDLFWKDVAKFYVNVKSEQEILTLKQAQDSINEGFKMLRENHFAEAKNKFIESKRNFLIAHNNWEAKLAEFWISYPLFLDHQYSESYSVLEPIAKYAKSNNYKWLNSQALGWLGINSGNLNHFSQEIEFYRKSLNFADETNDLYNQQKFNAQTADFYLQNGQFQDSLHFAQRISSNFDAEETSIRQKLRNYDVISRLFFSLGLNETAANFKKEALATWSIDKKDKVFPWINYTDLAVIYGKEGRFTEAFEFIEKARDEIKSFEGSRVRDAYIDLQTAQIKRFSNDYLGALDYYNKAIQFYDSTEFQPHRYTSHKGKLLCLLALNNNDEFEKELQLIFEILQQYRGAILEDSSSVAFFDNQQVIYDAAIDFEVGKDNLVKALNYSEESRARSLLDLLNQKGILTETELGPQLKHIGIVSSPLGINEIRKQLPANLHIVQFSVLSDKVLIWSYSKDNFEFGKVNISVETLNQDVKSYLKLLSERENNNIDEEKRLAKKLYEMLLSPIMDSIDQNKTICFIPDKFLFQIPFATLISPKNDKYLIAEHSITFSPSANVLLTCSKKANDFDINHEEKIIAIGNPTFDKSLFPNLQDLESATNEATTTGGYYQLRSILVKEDATKKNVINKIKESDVVQFAGHYVVNEHLPLLSGLVLAPENNSSTIQDSLLSNYEVFGNDFSHVRLIVLSACETGLEDIQNGEGPLGAARSFLAAGISQVVASQWSVDSASTSELMIRFHQYRKKEKISTIDALRKAQLDLQESKQFNRPYFWGAFAITGGYSRL